MLLAAVVAYQHAWLSFEQGGTAYLRLAATDALVVEQQSAGPGVSFCWLLQYIHTPCCAWSHGYSFFPRLWCSGVVLHLAPALEGALAGMRMPCSSSYWCVACAAARRWFQGFCRSVPLCDRCLRAARAFACVGFRVLSWAGWLLKAMLVRWALPLCCM